jgi:hypothetical protein
VRIGIHAMAKMTATLPLLLPPKREANFASGPENRRFSIIEESLLRGKISNVRANQSPVLEL